MNVVITQRKKPKRFVLPDEPKSWDKVWSWYVWEMQFRRWQRAAARCDKVIERYIADMDWLFGL